MRKEEGLERKKSIRHFWDLEVYRRAFDAARNSALPVTTSSKMFSINLTMNTSN